MIDKQKLARVLGMIGSSADGEALSAARKADAMVKAAGETWFSVFDVDAAEADLDAAMELCKRHSAALTGWERDFLGSIESAFRLTPKQAIVLARMTLKAKAYARRCGGAA